MRTIGYSFTAQVWVNAGGQWWRVDFMLEGEPVVVEFDGLAKYAGGVSSPSPAQLRHALATEKWREDRLREAGNEVVRVVWDDLDKVGLIRERIDQARSRARRTSDRSA
jgi:very-short-patch-repair endonuclease